VTSPQPVDQSKELHLVIPAEPAALFGVRARIRTQLQLSPLEPLEIDDVVLAVEEACTNAIRHSRSETDVDLMLRLEGSDLFIGVTDHGCGFDLSRFDPQIVPDPLAPGGRGLFLMSQLMDELDLRLHDGLEVRMRKRGSRDPQAPLYELADLIDINALQGLLDALHEAFDCPSAIIDNEARVLTATAWQDLCTQFHRVHPETLAECQLSDLHIYGHLSRGTETVAYVCPRGMIDCAAPIIIEGRHLGNVFIGQVFVEPPDLESFRRQAQRFGFDEEAYLAAVRRVPVIPREALDRRLPFVRALAEMVAEFGLARLKERELRSRSIEEP
jgi:anti-sigma regulatory factor (Ser/Thr protein kinase)/ligand-binding sensor protein